jgi:hypothetical protein
VIKLHPDWRCILKHAWSIQLDVLNILVTAALSVVPILTGTTLVAPLTLAITSAGLTVLSMGLRLLKQEKVSGHEPPEEE